MKIVFFAEGGGKTGLGHLRRSATLAYEFLKRRDKVEFLIRNNISKKWVKKHYPRLKIKTLTEIKSDVAIIDSYVISASEIALFNAKKIVGFADFGTSAKKYDLEISAQKQGIQYQIISPEFKKYTRRKNNNKLKKILITLGGLSNRKNINQILGIIKSKDVTLILPPTFSYTNTNKKIKIIKNPPMIGRFFKKNDLVISSGGQTIFELAATGTPTIVVGHAKNQKANIELIKKLKILKFAGWGNDKKLTIKLKEAISDLELVAKRNQQTRFSITKVDLNGAARVASLIKKTCG